jgi:sulfatase maturation enzyme AslB (radical SAM superfamily)
VGDVKECIGCKLAYLCGTGCRANAYFLHGNFNNAKDDYACKAMKFFMEQVIPLLEKFGVIKSNRLTNIRRKNMR